MVSFAHITNPVIVGESSDLYVAQPITFESMRQAQAFAEGQAQVELYSAQYHEDRSIIPPWVSVTKDLERSVLDLGQFVRQRKLPLIKDVLDRLYESSQADFFVYTNVDIALVPHFYVAIAQLIETGVDALVVNRRTIAKTPCNPAQLPLMWAQVGESHPGFDCFVFRRAAYPKFHLGEACIGVNWIGRVLLANLCTFAENLKIYENFHLTFHLGDDRSWNVQGLNDYDLYNGNEFKKILDLFQMNELSERCIMFKQFTQELEDWEAQYKEIRSRWWKRLFERGQKGK